MTNYTKRPKSEVSSVSANNIRRMNFYGRLTALFLAALVVAPAHAFAQAAIAVELTMSVLKGAGSALGGKAVEHAFGDVFPEKKSLSIRDVEKSLETSMNSLEADQIRSKIQEAHTYIQDYVPNRHLKEQSFTAIEKINNATADIVSIRLNNPEWRKNDFKSYFPIYLDLQATKLAMIASNAADNKYNAKKAKAVLEKAAYNILDELSGAVKNGFYEFEVEAISNEIAPPTHDGDYAKKARKAAIEVGLVPLSSKKLGRLQTHHKYKKSPFAPDPEGYEHELLGYFCNTSLKILYQKTNNGKLPYEMKNPLQGQYGGADSNFKNGHAPAVFPYSHVSKTIKVPKTLHVGPEGLDNYTFLFANPGPKFNKPCTWYRSDLPHRLNPPKHKRSANMYQFGLFDRAKQQLHIYASIETQEKAERYRLQEFIELDRFSGVKEFVRNVGQLAGKKNANEIFKTHGILRTQMGVK
jgi:hypothetical protein